MSRFVPSEPKLGIIAGLEAELDVLGRYRHHKRVICGATGANARRTSRAALRMWQDGCRMLLSWGLAGGLDDTLAPGDLILPDGVVDPTGRVHWLETEALGELADPEDDTAMLIAGSDQMVTEPEAKAALAKASGAVAVDMETHHIVRMAEEAAFPALAIRAIADPADRAIPKAAQEGIGPDGRPQIGSVLSGLAARPGDLPGLLALRRDYKTGLGALREVARTDVIERLIAAVPRI
ncbi:MAG: squalene--hopene cyclase [Pseudomonadota bacterium]